MGNPTHRARAQAQHTICLKFIWAPSSYGQSGRQRSAVSTVRRDPLLLVLLFSMAAATPRRSAKSQEMSTPRQESHVETTSKIVQRRAPFLPTSLEILLLSIYPATLLIGSLFSIINPEAHAAPYSATSQSHPPELAPSYFAQKSNIFNVLFVKRAWFWITVNYFWFLFSHPSTGPPNSLVLTPRRIRGILRWGLVTVWWIFVTQWFFGPAIIDRGFTLTGGQCELLEEAEMGRADMSEKRKLVTGIACKAVGGKWKGGHDISGHVFLLVLGSMFLFQELVHVVLRSSSAKDERTIVMNDGAVKSAAVESDAVADVNDPSDGGRNLSVKFGIGITVLSWWMLLMTAAYFHTWFEKLTGLLVAFSGIFLVYFLPRVLPAWRAITGMPGL